MFPAVQTRLRFLDIRTPTGNRILASEHQLNPVGPCCDCWCGKVPASWLSSGVAVSSWCSLSTRFSNSVIFAHELEPRHGTDGVAGQWLCAKGSLQISWHRWDRQQTGISRHFGVISVLGAGVKQHEGGTMLALIDVVPACG